MCRDKAVVGGVVALRSSSWPFELQKLCMTAGLLCAGARGTNLRALTGNSLSMRGSVAETASVNSRISSAHVFCFATLPITRAPPLMISLGVAEPRSKAKPRATTHVPQWQSPKELSAHQFRLKAEFVAHQHLGANVFVRMRTRAGGADLACRSVTR